MTWSLSASGHVDNDGAQGEADLATKLRTVLRDHGATSATLYTQHHGTIDLIHDDTDIE